MSVITPITTEQNLTGQLFADITSTDTTILVRHLDTKTGAARTPLSTSLFFTLNKDTSDAENVLATAHTTTSGITTYTGCTRGVSDADISVASGTGNPHSEGSPVGHVTSHLPQGISATWQNGTNASGGNKVIVGTETAADNTLEFATDATVNPKIYIDDSNESQLKGNRGDDEGAAGDYSIGQLILTTAERDALTSPLNGMTIYNSTTGQMEFREGGSWVANAVGASVPDASTTIAGKGELPTQTESDAGTVTGGTGSPLLSTPATTSKSIQNSAWSYAADAGSTDTYAITLAPAPTAYAIGQRFTFKANTKNTGAATLNVNGLGAKTLKKAQGSDLDSGDILANQIVEVVYDGTNMQVVSFPAAVATDNNIVFLTVKESVFANDLLCGERTPTTAEASTDSQFGLVTGLQKTANSCVGSGNSGSSITVLLKKIGSPTDNAVVRIETDNAGVPSGTLAHANATASITGSGLNTVLTSQTLNFAGSFSLTEGQLYWIVFTRSGSASDANNYSTGYDNTNIATFARRILFSSSSWGAQLTNVIYHDFASGILEPPVVKADANQPFTQTPIGFVRGAFNAEDIADIQTSGVNSGHSGLVPLSTYYMSDTAGVISTTAGTTSIKIGRAIVSDKILIIPPPL